MFVASIIMKNFEYTFEYSRIMFAINCAMFYVRIFRLYHASEALGPKLVILHRMVIRFATRPRNFFSIKHLASDT